MKVKFNVQSISYKTTEGTEMNFPGMLIETECTLEELKGVYQLQKECIKELPDLVTQFTKAVEHTQKFYQEKEGVTPIQEEA